MIITALGKHTLLDFYECDRDTLAGVDRVREILCEAARQGKATIVEEVFHPCNSHETRGVVVIAESHLVIHTWPEHGYAAVDIFTCGSSIDFARIEAYLCSDFRSLRIEKIELTRGAGYHVAAAKDSVAPGSSSFVPIGSNPMQQSQHRSARAVNR